MMLNASFIQLIKDQRKIVGSIQGWEWYAWYTNMGSATFHPILGLSILYPISQVVSVWSLFQWIFGKKYKNGLMLFWGNEKNTPFTQILFYT